MRVVNYAVQFSLQKYCVDRKYYISLFGIFILYDVYYISYIIIYYNIKKPVRRLAYFLIQTFNDSICSRCDTSVDECKLRIEFDRRSTSNLTNVFDIKINNLESRYDFLDSPVIVLDRNSSVFRHIHSCHSLRKHNCK